jgi:hypothetical protein
VNKPGGSSPSKFLVSAFAAGAEISQVLPSARVVSLPVCVCVSAILCLADADPYLHMELWYSAHESAPQLVRARTAHLAVPVHLMGVALVYISTCFATAMKSRELNTLTPSLINVALDIEP